MCEGGTRSFSIIFISRTFLAFILAFFVRCCSLPLVLKYSRTKLLAKKCILIEDFFLFLQEVREEHFSAFIKFDRYCRTSSKTFPIEVLKRIYRLQFSFSNNVTIKYRIMYYLFKKHFEIWEYKLSGYNFILSKDNR